MAINKLTTGGGIRRSVALIGGGPAGMSCALWLKHLGFSPCIIERNAALGGQLLTLHRLNRWVLGWQGRTSAELAQSYSLHVMGESIPTLYNAHLTAVEKIQTGFRLTVEESGQGECSILPVSALVIATGLTVRGIDIFNHSSELDSLYAQGLVGCHPLDHLDKLELLSGKTVAVIGGGDNAHFTVKDVATVAKRTYLLARSHPKAQAGIRREVQSLIEQGLVVEYLDTEVDSFRPNQDGMAINLKQSASAVDSIQVDRVFVRAGFAPNSQFLDAFNPLTGLDTLNHGYLWTDSCKRTSIESVYAIGDVASPHLQSVVTAIADGVIAARAIADDISIRG